MTAKSSRFIPVALFLASILGCAMSWSQAGQQPKRPQFGLPIPPSPGMPGIGLPRGKGMFPRTSRRHAGTSTSSASQDASSIFLEAPVYGSGGYEALSVAVADVNGDGIPDLVVANQCASSSSCSNGGIVSVLLGNGDGTFQTAVSYGSGGQGARSVAIVDVNGDGIPDVVVANECASSGNCANGGGVGVLLGNGDGTFQTAVSYGSGGYVAYSVAVADLNGNGIPDVVVANECASSSNCSNGVVGVLLGNGDGTFQNAVSYGSGGDYAYSVAVANLNGNGVPDLVVANECVSSGNCSNGGSVGVLMGNGDGTFQNAVSYGSGGDYAISVVVADLNGNGIPDVVVANECASSSNCANGGSVGVLLGNGDGTFQTAVSYGSGGEDAVSVAVADLNGNGVPDVVVANVCASSNCLNGSVGVLLGNGDGTFQTAVSYDSGGENPFSVAVADLNGNGVPDLVVTNEFASSTNQQLATNNSGIVGVLLGNGNGTFQAAINDGSGGADAFSVAVADLNGNGVPDLAVANYCASASSCSNGSVGVLLGNGDGTFQSAVSYGSGGEYALSVAVADLNGNGIPDLVAANLCANRSNCSNGGSVGVLLGNGDGTFQTAVSYASGGEYAYSAAVADLNGNGIPDVVVANNCASSSNCSNGNVGVLLGNGDGTFQTAVSYGSGGLYALSVAVADVNGDGIPDVVVGNECASSGCSSGGIVSVLLGNGDGTFQTAVSYGSGGEYALSVAVADVNGDGIPDLVVANGCTSSGNCSSGVVGVLLGNGDGTFQAATTTVTPSVSLGQLAVADFNGDGNLDVASGSGGFLLLGNGDGTFQPYINLGAGGNGIAVGDFLGNGGADLAVGGVTILLNQTQVIQSTTTTVTSSQNPSTYGQAVTFTATISDGSADVKSKTKSRNKETRHKEGVKSNFATGTVTWSANTGCGTTTVTTGSPATATCTTSGLNAGTNTITATYNGDSYDSASTGTLSGGQVVNPASQSISCSGIPASATYGTGFTASCTASSGLPVSYSSAGGCSNSGTSTYSMTSGTTACVVTVSQAGNSDYAAATPVIQTVNATLASQTITATPPAEAEDKDIVTVSASSSSGLTLSFASSGDCTNSGAAYTMGSKAGTCNGTITQAGNSDYAAAAPFSWSTTVITKLVAPEVGFTGASSSTAGGSSFVVTATYPVTQGVPEEVPTITASGSCTAGTVSGSGNTYQATITMTKGSGTCTMTAKWAANFYYASATETQKTTAVLITPSASFSGAPPSAANGTQFPVTASSNETGAYASVPTITVSGPCTAGAVTSLGNGSYQATITMTKNSGTCKMTAKWAASIEYAAATLTQSTTATK